MSECIVLGCKNRAANNISVRLRREDTTAIWAPNTEAFLCNEHAACGLQVDIKIYPNKSKSIETNVSAGGIVKTRITKISNQP